VSLYLFSCGLNQESTMASQPASELLAELKRSVGRELVFRAPDEIGRAAFRKYAMAISDFNPLYSDRGFAQRNGLRDVMAPPTLLCDTWQYVDSDMDERGVLIGQGEIRDLGGLRAGNEYEFFQPLHPDDVVTAYCKVKDVYEKTGRSGRLVFQETEVSFFNQRDELLARNTETLFYRL
jgi:acyl dehydratase